MEIGVNVLVTIGEEVCITVSVEEIVGRFEFDIPQDKRIPFNVINTNNIKNLYFDLPITNSPTTNLQLLNYYLPITQFQQPSQPLHRRPSITKRFPFSIRDFSMHKSKSSARAHHLHRVDVPMQLRRRSR